MGRVLITAADQLLRDYVIDATTKFKARVFHRADHSKPEAFMKFDGGDVIAISSDGDHLMDLRSLHSFDQGFEQQIS
jgi:hypothetical protein